MNRVLVVAGSDSGGGAGIQADLKTIQALGAYGMTAITALTAQNTQGVQAVLPVPPAFVRQQMTAVLDDIGADIAKTGMLGTEAVITAVARELGTRRLPLVLDPVMIAKGGAALLDPAALDALRTRLLPLATVLTPNVPEAEALLGRPIPPEAMESAARALLALGPAAVLLKGGHQPGDTLHDVLATPSGTVTITHPRIETRHTHGTGCTLASAIAASLAQGMALEPAVRRAIAYVTEAIRTAPGLGQGHGPLHHAISAAAANTSAPPCPTDC